MGIVGQIEKSAQILPQFVTLDLENKKEHLLKNCLSTKICLIRMQGPYENKKRKGGLRLLLVRDKNHIYDCQSLPKSQITSIKL